MVLFGRLFLVRAEVHGAGSFWCVPGRSAIAISILSPRLHVSIFRYLPLADARRVCGVVGPVV